MSIPSFSAIIAAAGNSERFNGNASVSVKKEYLKIGEHTILYRATRPFLEVPSLKSIIVICPPGQKEECAIALEEIYEHCPVPVVLCNGGKTRQESVFLALQMLQRLEQQVSYVAIHDGARPFLESDLIIRGLATACVYGGSTPATAITDAVKRIDNNGTITSHENRTGLVCVQTPQIFDFQKILLAHEQARNNGKIYVDDTEIYADFNQEVGVFEGNPDNRKITFLDDIPDANAQIAAYAKAKEEGLKQSKIDQEFRRYLNQRKEPESNA
ncbi:MAG: 2-C-methyl-D-erythritol 4-phosphate cytidylyltransferase [Spirochaetia bacterium]|jgi:2-C-methyl-D-erythritol 4-phosphate cytidylyltransferase/2-C-methyl-D-erythritol 4-phosphate cytidylyltransferase/2-C-methyl-D-erythritol 2,4-cyclodiphosphate synthase|nr:2-C-methyl-D-erythritol 4-phosphate cytidylyltransferase [Spirochaetia bacterium]